MHSFVKVFVFSTYVLTVAIAPSTILHTTTQYQPLLNIFVYQSVFFWHHSLHVVLLD